jgi:pimeloyl-ACP methyl ester carboxylesterase
MLSPIEPADSLARTFNPPARRARLDTTAARALVKARAAGRDTSDLAGYCEQFWAVNAPIFLSDTALAGRWQAPWCVYPNESPARLAAATAPVLDSLGPDVDLGSRAMGLLVPVLVIHGRDDLVANPEGAREWARRLPDARLLRLRDTGHLPFIEAASTLRRAIDFFLMGHWPPLAERPGTG